MAKNYIDYIQMDTNEKCPIMSVGCMNCGNLIGLRKQRKFDHSFVVNHFSNVKRKRVHLKDGTYADLLLCDKCIVIPIDLVKMEKTMKQAWMKENQWKYEQSTNPVHKDIKLKQFNLQPEEVLPLSFYKQMLKGKEILK